MKKSVLLAVTALLSVMFAGCAKKSVPQDVINLKIADIHTEGYPTVVGLHEFSRLVEERSHGKMKVEVIADCADGDEANMLEKVQFGKLDFARVSLSPIAVFDDDFEVVLLPGIFKNEIHFWKVMDGAVGEKLLSSLEKHDFIGLCYYDSGARSFYTEMPLLGYDDLRGKKIRVQQTRVMLDFMNELGAIPIPMGFREIQSALEDKIIDGAENNIPSFETTGHYLHAGYYFQDEHTRIADVIVGSKKTLSTLTEEQKKIIYEAAKDSESVQKLAWKEYEQTALKKLVENGVVFKTPSAAETERKLSEIKPVLMKRLNASQLKIFEEIESVK